MASDSKIYSVDKFLGVNQYADSETELKPGEAADILNFNITDGGNLTLRPGICVQSGSNTARILSYWKGRLGAHTYSVTVFEESNGSCRAMAQLVDVPAVFAFAYPGFDLSVPVKMFPVEDRLYIVGKPASGSAADAVVTVYLDGDMELFHLSEPAYVPTVATNSAPSGGGTALESINILSRFIRVNFDSDGEAVAYTLPSPVSSVASVTVNSETVTNGSYNADTRVWTFSSAPEKGTGNVEFLCGISDADLDAALEKFCAMPYCEAYNGDTNTRLFFYGDGTNICYYTGMPAFGSGLYLPAGNELAVDFSDTAVTGLIRHYSRLLAFKPDGVDAITYEPVTLADGSVIAGFYLRPVSRDFGNDAMGQVTLVNNAARTVSKGGAYDWMISYGNYRDERYAKRVSNPVAKLFASADGTRTVTCDDGISKTWYAFLNDGAGTVLVHRYDLDVWTVYRSALFEGVDSARLFEGQVTFLRDGVVYALDPDSVYDVGLEDGNGDAESTPIHAVWVSGFQTFGAAFRRKDSSRLWVSLLPEEGTKLRLSLRTDTRSDYEERVLDPTEAELYGDAVPDGTPFVSRIRLPLKRFASCRLTFSVTDPGAKATVIGYDQEYRYSSAVK